MKGAVSGTECVALRHRQNLALDKIGYRSLFRGSAGHGNCCGLNRYRNNGQIEVAMNLKKVSNRDHKTLHE